MKTPNQRIIIVMMLTLLMSFLTACDTLLAEENPSTTPSNGVVVVPEDSQADGPSLPVTETPDDNQIDQTSQDDDSQPQSSENMEADNKMRRESLFITVSEIVVKGQSPADVFLHLEGMLPTPCHQFGVEIFDPDDQNQIQVDVFALIEAERQCRGMTTPFTEDVAIGSFMSGIFQVTLNETPLGSFDAEKGGDVDNSNFQRGSAFMDAVSVSPSLTDSSEIMLSLVGSLPNPCHQLQVDLAPFNAESNQIHVDVYTLIDPAQMCIQVLQPFQEEVSLGSFPAGSYTVLVNGNEVGTVAIP